MITFAEIVSALKDQNPWGKMHEIVQRELAAGVRLKDIQNQLREWNQQVVDLDVGEDAQDAYGDTFDCVIGHCRPEQRYAELAQ